MKSAEFNEQAWLHTVKAAQDRDWDLPVDPRHNPEAALAAMKQAHLAPMAQGKPDAQPMAEGVCLYAPATVIVRGDNPLRFRLVQVKTGVARRILPVEENLLKLEADFRDAHIRVWLEQFKLLGARKRQARAADFASLRRSACGREEATRTLVAFEASGLPLHHRASWLARKFCVSTQCIRQRLKKGRLMRKRNLTDSRPI